MMDTKMMDTKAYKIRTGFFSETPHEYGGENIFRAVASKEANEAKYYLLDGGRWIRQVGFDQYVTDWLVEERWGRVEDAATGEELGFAILRVDREKGLRLRTEASGACAWTAPKETPPVLFSAAQKHHAVDRGLHPDRHTGGGHKAIIDEPHCRSCRMCVKICPVGAILAPDGKMRISAVCIGCRKCVKICPFDAIVLDSK
ncbi:MAG: 4Fe-4S binding protein [Clostridiales Family XIII bacterium]|jgi:ferredoxin|nr:4Fe-4S binding protein [Clostridiales Family XIII bacterium]